MDGKKAMTTFCKPCDANIPNCDKCNTSESCGQCKPDFFVNSLGLCQPIPADNETEIVIISDSTNCTALFPIAEDDHVRVCSQCTNDSCLLYEDMSCDPNFIFNNRLMECRDCQSEFGNGTVTCDRTGALECSLGYYPSEVQDEVGNFSNTHCKLCN